MLTADVSAASKTLYGNHQLFCQLIIICMLIVSLGKVSAENEKISHLAKLAQERYGTEAYENFIALNQLISDNKNNSDLEKLTKINDFFNNKILFVDDAQLWNTSDYWATPLETLGRKAGDCEDFSIAKYAMLRLADIDINKLRLVYVKATLQSNGNTFIQAHMVLSYYQTPQSVPLILDNLNPNILSASNRKDLSPIFSFNSSHLWVGNNSKPKSNPSRNLSRWQDALNRMSADGL